MPPPMVSMPFRPSVWEWSMTAIPRLMWRVSSTETRLSLISGRDPDQACSARALRKPGIMCSPASSICCTSLWGMGRWSGSVSWTSVVPMMETVWTGTRMSPSVGYTQRLMTVFTMRWFIAIMIPRPGTTATGSAPAISAICPAHGPAQLRTKLQSMRTSSPPFSSRQRTAATRAPSRSIFVTRW